MWGRDDKDDGPLLLLLLLGARGLKHIGDVLSSCPVMIGMTQQNLYIYSILFDGRPQFNDDTHNNQPKTGGGM